MSAKQLASFRGVVVLVDVNPDGSVKGARIIHSEGNLWDFDILHDAKTSHYRPKMVDCKPVEGVFYYYYFYPRTGN